MGPGDPHVPGATLEEDMRRFLVSSGDELSDFRLTLEGTVIPTHRAVLAARSSYFDILIEVKISLVPGFFLRLIRMLRLGR